MMPTDFTFRLSTYLTLGFACVCLGQAEWDYLPEVTAFTGVVVVLLIVSFVTEGRFALGLNAANAVGFVLFLAAFGYVAAIWRKPDSLIHTLPWPAGLLPVMAPILMVVMAAKLFRPKHTGDWWAMHALGLISVSLAGSLADDGWFVVFFVLYAIAGVWSLSLFYQRRSAGLIAPIPANARTAGEPVSERLRGDLVEVVDLFLGVFGVPPLRSTAKPADAAADPPVIVSTTADRWRTGGWQARRPIGWLFIAAAFALPLFFLTPRSNGARWALGSNRVETGYAPTNTVDLSRSVTLRNTGDLAFEVTATYPDDSPKEDLPGDQLWRGTAYMEYAGGKWSRGSTRPNMQKAFHPDSGVGPNGPLPDLGEGQYYLDYRLTEQVANSQSSTSLLANPIVYVPGQPAPVGHQSGRNSDNGLQNVDGTFEVLASGRKLNTRYRQVNLPQRGDVRGIPFRKNEEVVLPDSDLFLLLRKRPSKAIIDWTNKLFDRLLADGILPREVADRRTRTFNQQPDPQDHAAIARAFCDYLTNDRAFHYSLELTRADKTADPIEDFLFTTKSGHCERFATALVLMLRAVDIPAMFVLGFKGAENTGHGTYTIRQDHAHAWVEAIVPAEPVGPEPADQRWTWITLDPTPGERDDEAVGLSGMWGVAKRTGQQFLNEYVIGMNPTTQKKAAAAIGDTTTTVGPWLIGAVILAGAAIVILRRVRKLRRERVARHAASLSVPFFARLMQILTSAGHPFPPGLTPREYADAVGKKLAASPATQHIASVPRQASDAVYESRYAGRTLSEKKLADLDAGIDRLSAAFIPR